MLTILHVNDLSVVKINQLPAKKSVGSFTDRSHSTS